MAQGISLPEECLLLRELEPQPVSVSEQEFLFSQSEVSHSVSDSIQWQL